jgi:tripartite-type tricarboxylate transporter receptor subunit TctC
MFSNISDAVPQAQAGAIRMLGVSTKDRSAQIADVPTIAESGYPSFNVVTWNGLMAPAGTPKEIIDKMAAEIGRAVKDKAFVARLDQMGADPLGNTPEEFSAMIATETALWADTVKSLGLKF